VHKKRHATETFKVEFDLEIRNQPRNPDKTGLDAQSPESCSAPPESKECNWLTETAKVSDQVDENVFRVNGTFARRTSRLKKPKK
jgi:hypothetical protein